MANTPNPRDFDRVSRAVLVFSLWRESLGRVPMEAMANGIPVVASDRGPLPETLGSAGFVFTIEATGAEPSRRPRAGQTRRLRLPSMRPAQDRVSTTAPVPATCR